MSAAGLVQEIRRAQALALAGGLPADPPDAAVSGEDETVALFFLRDATELCLLRARPDWMAVRKIFTGCCRTERMDDENTASIFFPFSVGSRLAVGPRLACALARFSFAIGRQLLRVLCPFELGV